MNTEIPGEIMAQDILIVVDMQNDFINGALGNANAVSIVPKVVEKIKEFKGLVLYTRDTHGLDYLDTQEGENLPIPHCIEKTEGWQLYPDIRNLAKEEFIINKITFGSDTLAEVLEKINKKKSINSITLVGLCTDICVISNALLIKTFFPEVRIIVDEKCCAGVTKERHDIAVKAMESCQIVIE